MAADQKNSNRTAPTITEIEIDEVLLGHLRSLGGALRAARAALDVEAERQIGSAILELFSGDVPPTPIEHEEAVEKLTGGTAAEAEAAARNAAEHFHARYATLKAEARLNTREAVAECCLVHINTVHGLESRERFPQWRTVVKLAAGFERVLGRPIDPYWLQGLGTPPSTAGPPHASARARLSERERRLIRLAQEGRTEAEITAELVGGA
ncbi:MAG: hypothetical protein ACT4PL_11855 [Phycisphaerales bacterium]